MKKDRHSATGVRGTPKKGGAGGKGTWGIGGVDDLKSSKLDKNDPNYDSQEDMEETVIQPVEMPGMLSPVEQLVSDFFKSGDVEEFIDQIKERDDMNDQLSYLIKKAIIMAGEKHAFERELVSQLLSKGYNAVFTSKDIEDGFQKVLDSIDDMALDTPDAPEVVSKFLARAIVDEVIPPIFLKNVYAESKQAVETVALSNALITEKHRIDRLAHIWGPGDLSSVKRLKKEVGELLEEYLTNEDANEADKSVRNLNAPSFHFFVVKHALRLALQKNDGEREKLCKLLQTFNETALISPQAMKRGFECCFDTIQDISLDVPNAKPLLEKMKEQAIQEGWLTK